MENKVICSYGCGKEAKYFFKTGKGCCEKSPNTCEGKRIKDSQKKKGKFNGVSFWMKPDYIPWNKGKKTAVSDETKIKISNSLKGRSTGRGSTPEIEESRKRKISETMKKNPKSGGLRKGSGRGKKGWYCGYWCDSSWELAWVIYNLENGILFERNNIGFNYLNNGSVRKYYPDFKIGDTYYEIKGRRKYDDLDNENKEKINQFKYKLEILYTKDMSKYLDYVIKKYGKDYIKLYKEG